MQNKPMDILNSIPQIQNTNTKNVFLIAGPCVIENEKMTFDIAEKIKKITSNLNIPFIFKASFKKANRSRLDSFTGIGNKYGLEILKKIKSQLQLPTITDIHSVEEAQEASTYVDVLQIPAFLCRQTDLLVATAKTQKVINIKKGQFLSPEAMKFAVEKIFSSGNNKVMLTERGSTFGYNDLVIDFRSIPIMQKNKVPVILDATHALQQPNQSSGITGGKPELIETVAKAGVASGVDGIFIETHPEPHKALSDGSNMLKLDLLEELLIKLKKIRKAIL